MQKFGKYLFKNLHNSKKSSTFAAAKVYKHQKLSFMATYAVNINERTQAGKSLFLYLNSLGVISERLTQRRRAGIDEALDDVRNGRVYKADSVDAMFKQILG